MNRTLLFSALAILAFSCSQKETWFQMMNASESGIDFENSLTESDDFNILDYLYFYNGGGVSIGDINNDGLADIFLSGNQVSNKLYLNEGNLKFRDITESAGVSGKSNWHTGSSMADVNSDGYLDIYVCTVVGLKGLRGYNELYINNGDNTFTEAAQEYGLDFEVFGSSAAFFDFDLDGDLDLYLLNHAVHTQESFGHADVREKRDDQTGDRLLRNDNGRFVDISEEAGIYGGANGYGLGVSILDFNHDRYPDIYISNDFHEDDYFYENNGDGTFTESIKKYFSHTSRFSMGVDAADINHDGWSDILTLDMLPDKEEVLKRSAGDEDYDIQRLKVERFGYHYQYSRNMLQVNQGDFFNEVALLSGVAATDWSWSVLIEDFDNDSHQDVFISNGIPRRPNDLDYIKFVSSDQIKNKINSTKLVDQQALAMMPSGQARNFLFKGSGDYVFEDRSNQITPYDPTFSNAMATGDLDNDGDLDLVVNNINSAASVYVNQTGGHHLRVRLNGEAENTYGIGSKVFVYCDGKTQYKELFTSRGFQGSSEPILHFGLDQATEVDSVRIVWPNGYSKLITGVPAEQLLVVDTSGWKPLPYQKKKTEGYFEKVPDNLGLDFVHEEDSYIDFHRQNLMPYMLSNRGPATVVADFNGDDLEDVFFAGAKFSPTAIFEQQGSGFVQFPLRMSMEDSVDEAIDGVAADFSNNGEIDLLVVNGGGDFFGESDALVNKLYQQGENGFEQVSFPKTYENSSTIAISDFDQDGDVDVFIGSQSFTGDFGNLPDSYLYENDGGEFRLSQTFEQLGMVTGAIWSDFDADGWNDLIIVGEWMKPRFFRNDAGTLNEVNLMNSDISGLWQMIIQFDVDQDGDGDYVLGNWGLNSKFVADTDHPLKMYYDDFDDNGSTETILAAEKDGEYYPLETFDELAKQMVHLRKKYNRYQDFAGQTVEQIFEKTLSDSEVLEVNELRSGVLINDNGSFTFEPFDIEQQFAPILAGLSADFDADGTDELLLAGNFFGIKPFMGRLGAYPGALLDNGKFTPANQLGLNLANRSVRHLNILDHNEHRYLLVTVHNDSLQIYKINR